VTFGETSLYFGIAITIARFKRKSKTYRTKDTAARKTAQSNNDTEKNSFFSRLTGGTADRKNFTTTERLDNEFCNRQL
jgi:hypothetical protein